MKFKETAMANAVGALGAIYFLGCWLLTVIAPDLYKAVAESWMHTVNLSVIWKVGQSNFLLGFVSFTVVSWLTGYLFAWLYNRLSKG